MYGHFHSQKISLGKSVFIALTAGLFLGRASTSMAAPGAELILPPSLVHELNLVLKTGTALQKSLVSQDEEQIEMGVRDMIWQIEQSRSASRITKPHVRNHLTRILDGAKEQFELSQTAFGDEKRARLEDGFNQLVNLARIYRLDHAYTIFFCAKDRTTWIQRGARPQDPFRPTDREPCGIPVPYK